MPSKQCFFSPEKTLRILDAGPAMSLCMFLDPDRSRPENFWPGPEKCLENFGTRLEKRPENFGFCPGNGARNFLASSKIPRNIPGNVLGEARNFSRTMPGGARKIARKILAITQKSPGKIRGVLGKWRPEFLPFFKNCWEFSLGPSARSPIPFQGICLV